MNDRIAEEVKKRAVNNRLPCREARRIAEELAVPYKEVGRTADELNVKITGCELGCF
jgi:LAO/AO transport system kinase